jgi:hypothetical protein
MGSERQESKFERSVFIAWIAWAISMLLPAAAIRGSAVEGKLGITGDIVFPGWQAAVISVLHPEEVDRSAFRFLIRLMGLTNVVIALSPATLVTRRRRVKNAFMFLAAGAACLDATALVGFVSVLSYGFLVWLASFVTLALTLSRDRSAPRPF